MIPITNLRAGAIFVNEDKLYRVLRYEHQKIGRGKATIKIFCRDIKNGQTREFNFSSGSKVEEVEVFKKTMEFVYFDERQGKVVLSDSESKKRVQVDIDVIGGENLKYLKEGQEVLALTLVEADEIVGVEIPITVELKVTETTTAEKGDTAGSARKPATLETGAIVHVPMFVKVGDIVKVNTERGEYIERISNV